MTHYISDYYYIWIGSDLHTDYDTPHLQNIVTTIYIVLNILIAFVGERLIKRHGQRKLLNSKPLAVTDLSPFLSISSTLKHIWDVRRLPGGLFGLLMIASGAFGLSSRYLVNSFIYRGVVTVRHNFSQGIVSTYRGGNSEDFFRPAASWPATALVRRAQQAVAENKESYGYSCSDGVYATIDNETVTKFCPNKQDVLGRWNCAPKPPSVISPLNSTTMDNFAHASNFTSTYYWSTTRGSDDDFSDILVWSSNTKLAALDKLDFRITFASGLNSTQSAFANNYECTLAISTLYPAWSPTNVDVDHIGSFWKETMLGSLLDISSDLYQSQMESVLNAVTMVAGSANSLWPLSATSSEGGPPSSRLVVYRTVAQIEVFAILSALVLILLFLVVTSISEMILNKKDEFQPVVASLPITPLEWQLALTKKLVNDDNIIIRDLSFCEYSWNKVNNVIGCRDKRVQPASSDEVGQESKVAMRAESRLAYVWNSEFKTIDQQARTADDVRNDSSEISISKGDTVVTTGAL